MKYWLIKFRLDGGWTLTNRLIADDMVDAATQARASLKHHAWIPNIDRITAEITELDMETGAAL